MNEALDGLKAFLNETIFPNEIIQLLLVRCDSQYIKKDPAVFYQVIYDLKQRDEFKDLLEEFTFKNGLNVYSKKLKKVLFQLEMAGVLVYFSPDYKKYEIKHKKINRVQIEKKFDEKQKEKIEKMAEYFEEQMKLENN